MRCRLHSCTISGAQAHGRSRDCERCDKWVELLSECLERIRLSFMVSACFSMMDPLAEMACNLSLYPTLPYDLRRIAPPKCSYPLTPQEGIPRSLPRARQGAQKVTWIFLSTRSKFCLLGRTRKIPYSKSMISVLKLEWFEVLSWRIF